MKISAREYTGQTICSKRECLGGFKWVPTGSFQSNNTIHEIWIYRNPTSPKIIKKMDSDKYFEKLFGANKLALR